MSAPTKEVLLRAKPLLSLTPNDARRRVLGLYKAWMRQAQFLRADYDLPKTEEQIKAKIRENFEKHRHVKDIRVIDMLVVKGQMELKETVNLWKTTTAVMHFFRETYEPKPSTFLGKFLSGQD